MRDDLPHDPKSILLATPDSAYAISLKRFMQLDNYRFERCHDSKGVLRLIGRQQFDVLILDLELRDTADLDLVSFVRRQSPDTRIILVYDSNQVDLALDGIRHGAFFYLPKSCQPSDVALIVQNAMKALNLEAAAQKHERSLFQELAESSPAMRRVVEIITKVSPTDSTVLLLGESGTGKEVLANAIHNLSSRRDKAFVAINCAALPEQLLESEMFGHVKGAFTGAGSDKKGLFEEADGGTLFLDEIGDMALSSQAKLLRVLQNGEIRPVGASKTHHVDVRVLAATNLNLVEAVAGKVFREDLYFRLNVIQITIPPLRERLDALPSLVKQFLRTTNAKYSKTAYEIDEEAWAVLQSHGYPGNIRELESIIAHAVIMSEGDLIRVRDLPDHIRFAQAGPLALPDYATGSIPTLQQMEEQLIRTALDKLDGNQTEVAKRMGVSRSTLWRKMKEYGISKVEESPITRGA